MARTSSNQTQCILFQRVVFSLYLSQLGRLKPPCCCRALQHASFDKSLERMCGQGQTLGATAPRGARHLSAGTATSEWHGQREGGRSRLTLANRCGQIVD